ncbi:MAG: sensor histidine kinase [Lentisphaerae bacterium]|nr:sensor histidine kinase [Lentisphaerota bacterium]
MQIARGIWTAGLILALLAPAAQALGLPLAPWRTQTGDNPAWARPDFDDRNWPEQARPGLFKAWRSPHRGWYRVRFDLPSQHSDSGWAVHLGRIQTADEVFLNGIPIGAEGRFGPGFVDALHTERVYALPANALRDTGNVLAVRVQSSMAKGGIAGEPRLGERDALLEAAFRRAQRQKQREALVFGLLGTTLLFWLLLHRHGKEDSDYRLLGLLLSLLAGTFVLESLWFHESPWSTPAMQRLSIGLFILLPLPIFQLGRAWSESRLLRRLLGGLSAASLLMTAAWLAIGGVSLCQWVEPVWFGMILIGGGAILLECLRIRKRLRDPIAASVLAGLVWLGALGSAEYAMGIGMPDRLPFNLLFHSGFAGLVLALAVALALRYRRTNRQLRRLSQQIVATQEAERKRLAADLHNDIAPALATLKLDLQLLFRKHGRDNEGRPVIETLAHAIEEIRTLSHELRPAVVDQLGLPAALRGLAERLARRHGWGLDLDLPDVFARLPADTAVSLYRMAQEALYNAARHADARTIGLSLRALRRGIELRVTDDGQGCDPGRTGSGGGIGWLTLRERAAALGGTCRIRSQPGHGLEITLWIPLP